MALPTHPAPGTSAWRELSYALRITGHVSLKELRGHLFGPRGAELPPVLRRELARTLGTRRLGYTVVPGLLFGVS